MNQNILSYNPDIPDPIHRQRNKQLYEDLQSIKQDLKQAAATGDFTGLEPRIQKAKQQAEALKQETLLHQEKVSVLLPEIARSLEKQAQPSYDALKLILTDLPASAKEQLSHLPPITPELTGTYDPDTETYNKAGLTAEQQLQSLTTLQHTQPNLACPTVLEAMCYWYGLRARGDTLNTNTAYFQTYIRHFDLEAKELDDYPQVPDSCVLDDGEPSLFSSNATNHDDGRSVVR